MRNQNYFNRPSSLSLLMTVFAFAVCLTISQPIKAQGKLDLKTLKAEKEAAGIASFTKSLGEFLERVGKEFEEIVNKGNPLEEVEQTQKELKFEAANLKRELANNYVALKDLIGKLKTGNRWDDQFDKDAATLMDGSKIKRRLTDKGARKFLENGMRLESMNNLKTYIDELVNLTKFKRNDDACNYLAIGIVVNGLSLKRATTPLDKFYEQNACSR